MKKNIKDNIGASGIITLTNYLLDSPEAIDIDKFLSETRDITSEKYDECIARLREICTIRQIVLKNKVVLVGRGVLAGRLAGETTYTGAINYGALGSGTTPVASSDTALTTEVFRKLIATRTRVNAQTTVDFYFSKADTNGTYQEFGVFIDGTSTPGSGVMYNHVLTGGWTKTSLEALTVSAQFNINEV